MAPLDLNHIAVSEGRGDAAQALHALHTLGLDEREVEEVDEGELLEMAAHLGCEVDAIDQLPTSVRWIVEKALEAPLPDNWSEATDDKGGVYYFNRQTHKTSWDHPMDDYFRIMVQKALMNPLADELDSPARAIARGSDAHSTAAAATATSNSSPSPVAVDSPNLSTGFTTPPAAVVPAAVSTPPTVVVPPPAAAGVDALKRAADGDYSPATVRYALHLGLTPEIDTELLWVAEQALNAPLPPNWSEDVTDDGTVFFRNSLTGAVNWAHPLDDHFRGLIVKLKLQQQRASERARRGDTAEEDEDEDEDDDDYSSHTDDDDSTSTDGSTMMSGSGWTASASAGGDSVPGTTFKDVQIALGLRSALDGAAAAPTGRHSAGAGGGGGSGSSPSTSTADTRAVAPAPTWASERQRQQRRHARSREKSEKGEKGRTRIAELGRALSGRLRRLSAHGNNAASSSQQPKSRPTSAAARAKLEWERNVLNLDSTIGSEEDHSLSNSSLKLQGLT